MNLNLLSYKQSKQFKKLLFLVIILFANFGYSQSGKDGALTISTTNTVLNRYTRVTADVPVGSSSVTVSSISELNRDGIGYLPAGYTTNAAGFSSNTLQYGDLILLFQAQGAIIDTSNTINYGDLTNLNNAGKYELAYVGSVSGNTITLNCKTRFAYFAANYVQCIRIPQYTTLTVNSGASVVPIKWGDPAFGGADPSAVIRRRGGFLGIIADYIVSNGSINANAAGFRGGTFTNGSVASGDVYYKDYVTTVFPYGSEKGESIAGYRADYDAMGGRYGMGAPANGGGGGNGHNCGGGGGANGGDPSAWFRGAGVMNHFGICGTPGAWALDPNYIANGNALTNSSGGGHGGYSYSQNNANACTVGPSYPANFISAGVPLTDVLPSAWGGDKRKAFGGLGGRPLISPAIDRQIFFGGGGGAGDGNNNAANDGGDGGGVVFLVVKNSITGTGSIQANGENGANTQGAVGNDAPGGGGGGGTILVQATSVSSLPINANGGSGGNQIINLGNEGEGVAGGGSGGAIYMNTPSDASTKTVNGGANGTTNSVGITEFIANGATSGNTGSLSTAVVYIDFASCLTDLKIEKTADTLTPILGNNITFTLTASNLGQNDAVGVNVTDLLSSGYTFVSATPSVGTYDNTTGIWTIGNLANGAVETITIVATVNSTGTYSNTATITGDVQDPITANNTSTITPIPTTCTVGVASAMPILCINSALTAITHATTGATGIGTPTGLPTGVSASWSANVITISGTPTQSGLFNYSIPLTSCSSLVATGTITVQINTVTTSSTSRICVNTALTPITRTTTLATGIGTATGLPSGVSASWLANAITISGTPTTAGTFNYSIPLTGGCGSVNATGTIIVTNINNTVSVASSTPTLCVNIALTPITHTTTQATGIGTPIGLPTGVSAVWSSNTITIFGAPTSTGVYNYSIPLTGGCSVVNATGTITVNGPSTVSATSTRTVCINVPITPITRTTTFGTSIGTVTGMPPGITASISANVLTISGTPTTNGVYNYTIPVNGPCANVNATGTITVVSANVPGSASSTPTLCINTALTAITFTTGAATGISNAGVSGANGLPTGVSASWAANTITITGTPTQSGTFNYSIPLTGGCGTVNSTGTITVRATNTAGTASSNPTLCINTALTAITRTTTGATGIGTATGLPTGVTSSWLANVLTISGTPTVAGTFNYTIPLTGGCGTVNATGTITVTAANTAGTASSNPTLCINTALTSITRTTTGATGIGTATGIPTGVSASWSANVITISGTPTQSGTFNYTIPLTGGCGAVNATGTITVTAANTPGTASSNPTLCINTALTAITRTTTGATGISNAGVSGGNGLPTGVSASWAANVITVSGTPTQSGTFNYSIPLTGGCGAVNATGTITVTAANTVGTASSNPTLCINTALTNITRTTTGATSITNNNVAGANGLPAGVRAVFASNTITISGTPTASGTFNYSIPLTGGCGTVNATGTIIVTAANTAGTASSNPTLCINTALTNITRTTTGATGIGIATGLPTGVSASWSANVITISGTPSQSGTFNYTIPLTGGCGAVNATGTITVSAATVAGTISGTATVCTGINSTTLTLGGSTGTRQWQSATSLGGIYSNISGATGTTYTATNLNATTYYKVVVTSGVCSSVTSSVFTLTVSPTTVAGTVASAQTICTGTAPTNFTLSGNTGTVTNWQKATNVGFTTGVVTYANTTTTLPSASVGNLTANTYFRATIQSGACAVVTTTPVLVTVNAASSTTGMIINTNETICSGSVPNSITLTGTAPVGSVIKWQSASNIGFTTSLTDIANTTTTLNAASIGALTATTYYRAVIQNGVCAVAYSPICTKTVNAINTGLVTGTTSLCTGTGTALTISGYTAGAVLQWQSATTIGGTYGSAIGTTTNATYNTGNLTVATPNNFRVRLRVTLNTVACTAYYPALAVSVSPTTVAGTISGGTTVCTGTNSTVLTLGSNIGTVQWQSATTLAGTYTNIAGETNQTYTATNLTANTYYKAVVKSGACASATTGTAATITVSPVSVGGTVSSNQTLCTASAPANLTLSGQTGGVVKWQKSATSDFATPTDIASTSSTLTSATIGTVSTTTYFRAVVQNSVCTTSNSNYVTIDFVTYGGTVSGTANICSGTQATDLTLSGYSGTIIKWQKSLTLDFASPIDIATTSATLAGTTIGNISASTYFRAVILHAICGNIYSTIASMNITTTTWNGTSWDNGVPNATTRTIMTGNYTSPANGATDNLYMCNLTVTNGAVVNVLYGDNFIVTNEVTVVPGSSLTFESNANLVQINNVADSGNIIVKRNTNFQKRMDYVLWSTPVVGQNLKAFSPLTFVSETVSRFYDYNSLTNQYKYIFTPEAYTFATGKGYLIRMPNTFSDTVAATFYGQFTGVPNNGDITVSVIQSGATDGGTHTSYNNAGVPTYNVPNVSTGYNAIGNPYPSTLDLDSFIIDNNIAEAIYFWRKTNNTTTSSYATYTRAGGVRNTEFTLLLPGQVFDYNQITPSGVLQVGQGFIFKSVGPTVTFTNSMRFTNNANQFFRSGNAEKNRIWLNLSSETATYNQTMVSYMTGATNGVDAAIDGKYINDCQTALTTYLNNTEYVIQGKGLPFEATDIVPLAFKNTLAGNYTITLDHVDGLFSGNQDIYLKDNVANITHDLKQSAYTFASDSGVFNSRFELVYSSSPLATQNPAFTDNSVVVYKQNEVLNVNTGSVKMKGIKIFDVRGRLLYEKSAIGATSLMIKELTAEQQVLVVQITSEDDKMVVKKMVF